MVHIMMINPKLRYMVFFIVTRSGTDLHKSHTIVSATYIAGVYILIMG